MFGFKEVKEDKMYNRRRFMVLSALYFVIWGFVILCCTIAYDLDTAKVVAFLGYITTISGTGVGAYFWAVRKEDANGNHKTKDPE